MSKLSVKAELFETVKSFLIDLTKRRFWARYFDKGTVGIVKRCIEKSTGKVFAVKQIKSREEETILNLQNEFQHLLKLNHDQVIQVHELIIDRKNGNLNLVMEFFPGKELFMVISQIGHYDGQLSRKSCQNAVQTIAERNSLPSQKRHHPQGPQT